MARKPKRQFAKPPPQPRRPAFRLPPHPSSLFERLARACTNWAGSSWAFALALGIVLVWLITGPIFKFSDTWQLVINTGPTIVTFLMVFLIQRAQNNDSRAI